MRVISVYSRFASAFLVASTLIACPFPTTLLSSAALGQEATALPAPQPLITQAIDESQLTTLKGNTHPLARPQYDLGVAPASLPMERMLLVLKRSPEQEFALRKLLDDQQDRNSPSYHKWLTPEEFGKQFGPTDADMQTITAWLQSHGFQVGTTKGRTVLEFSGSASQVQEAFHTTIHKYLVNGEQHWANASDPQIPTALTPAVAGVLTLHNFLKKPQIHLSKQPVAAKLVPGKRKHDLTFSDGKNGLGPDDFATIYNSPAFNEGASGVGVTIGIVGRSNLFNSGQDIDDFANVFLCCGRFSIVLNGPDPGDLGGGEEAEATLDTTWSGAAAPGAIADLVVSATTNTTDGIDLSEVYIIENNLADVMSESFSSCEAQTTSADAAGISALAEQAATQGITYFVSTGDNGAEGCDDQDSETIATGTISVNVLASTAFNVAVGGTVFNENGQTSTYWSSTNNSYFGSALSYIPEDVWNDSCESPCSDPNIWAGSGGASIYVSKPSWQSGVTGIPSDNARDLPDVSLTAASHDPYLLCLEGSCVPNAQGEFYIYFVGGTSASAPSFAGIMALVDQQMGGRQGAANYVIYRLAATETWSNCNGSSTSGLPASTCIFNDITVGNNAVPGEVNYGQSNADYQAGVGYDLATGLGSVNIMNLVNQWNTVTFNPTTTTLTLNNGNAVNITHGQSVPLSITVKPNSGSGTPTGDVVLLLGSGLSPSTMETFPLSGGQTTSSINDLPGGSNYSVSAHYGGNATYAPSDSTMVSVTVNPEASTTTESAYAYNQNGNSIPLTNIPFGSTVFVRADVAGKSDYGVPTGLVTFTDTFGSLPGSIFNPVPNPAPLNSQGNTSIGAGVTNFDAGSHSISASYGGDASFSASSSTTPVTFSIQPGLAVIYGPTGVIISSPGQSGTSTVGIIASTGFSTQVSFACTSGLPAESTCSPLSLTGNGPNNLVTGNITVTTTAPHTTMLQRYERHYYYAVLFGGLPLAGIFLVALPRRRRSSVLLGIMLLALVVTLPACGGGGGGGGNHQQDPGTPAGTYTVTVTATAGSLQQSGTFTLVVQ
jgi:hypothetical protein